MKQFRILDPNLPPAAQGLCALAVMTNAQQAGRVKTRLVPPLTPEQAAELNKCFLRDTAAAISTACSRRPACPPKPRRRRVGDVQFEHAGASHSEAATAACGIRSGRSGSRRFRPSYRLVFCIALRSYRQVTAEMTHLQAD